MAAGRQERDTLPGLEGSLCAKTKIQTWCEHGLDGRGCGAGNQAQSGSEPGKARSREGQGVRTLRSSRQRNDTLLYACYLHPLLWRVGHEAVSHFHI